MKTTSVILIFICSISFAFSQNINLDDVRSLLDGVIKNKKNKKIEWSGVPGDSNFNLADRIAIQDVINAYGVYWDENDLKGFFNLFLDDAIIITYDKNGNEKKITKSDYILWTWRDASSAFINALNVERRVMLIIFSLVYLFFICSV